MELINGFRHVVRFREKNICEQLEALFDACKGMLELLKNERRKRQRKLELGNENKTGFERKKERDDRSSSEGTSEVLSLNPSENQKKGAELKLDLKTFHSEGPKIHIHHH